MMIMREGVSSMPEPRERQRKRLGRWADDPDVLDLSNRPDEVGKYLTEADASRRTGLTAEMLSDNRRRARITNLANPMSAVSRPAARFGIEPLYSHEQCRLYVRKANAPVPKVELPTLSAAEAEERGLEDLDELAVRFGLSKHTLERYARQYEDFPHAVARRWIKRGQPKKLRPIAAVDDWFTAWRAEQEAV